MRDWNDHAFVMLAPDAFRRGLVPRIIERLTRAGLYPTRWAVGEITPVQADAMHGPAATRSGDAYRYRCLDVLFALGPCLMLRLRAGPGVTRPIHEHTLAVRGGSTVETALPGSIRHDLKALNRVMSLLHVSDGPAEAEAEAAILVPGGVTGPARSAAVWHDADDLPAFLQVLAHGGTEDRDLAAVRRELRAAVLTRTWSALDEDLRAAALDLLRDGTGTDDVKLRRSFAGAHPAAALLPLSFLSPVDLPAVERDLASAGLALDDWQRAVLTTSMYFAPW